MKREQSETPGYCRLEVVASMVRLPTRRVRRFVRLGLVQPSRSEGRAYLFGEAEIARLRKIRRLTEDLGLNAAGVDVALRLVEEIEALRRQAGQQGENSLALDIDSI